MIRRLIHLGRHLTRGSPAFRVLLTTSVRSGKRVGTRGEEVGGSLLSGTLRPSEGKLVVDMIISLPESLYIKGRNSIRGITMHNGRIAVATCTDVFFLDRKTFQIEDSYTSNRLGDIHSLLSHNGILYITATTSDSVVGINDKKEVVFDWCAWHEPQLASFVEATGDLETQEFRTICNNFESFHINHISVDHTGDLFVNLSLIRKVFNITKHGFAFKGNPLSETSSRGSFHDGEFYREFFYYSDTSKGEFVKYSFPQAEKIAAVDTGVSCPLETEQGVIYDKGWLRGAKRLYDEVFLLGQINLNLKLVDMATGSILKDIQIYDSTTEQLMISEPYTSMYCIELLPDF